MKFKTLVVDDELDAQKRLLLHLSKFEKLQVLEAKSNGQEALETIRSVAPDIIFLDVEMPVMSGIDVLANCEEPYPYIIFVTAYNQYAVEAFEQNAVDYVLKPYTFERIQRALNKAIDMIEKDRLANINENFKDLLFSLSAQGPISSEMEFVKRIAVKSIGHTRFIPVEDIIYIEAADQYVEVHTAEKKFTVRESMDKLERTLDPKYFFRTHRSYLVNLESVRALENVDKHVSLVLLSNGKKVKITGNRKPDFKEKMNF